MQVFSTLKLLVVLLGPSFFLWGRSGHKMAPKMVPQMAPIPNKRHRLSLPELSQKLLFPRQLQDSSRWPQVVQDSLLGAFLGLQRLSWKALDLQKPSKNNGLTFA